MLTRKVYWFFGTLIWTFQLMILGLGLWSLLNFLIHLSKSTIRWAYHTTSATNDSLSQFDLELSRWTFVLLWLDTSQNCMSMNLDHLIVVVVVTNLIRGGSIIFLGRWKWTILKTEWIFHLFFFLELAFKRISLWYPNYSLVESTLSNYTQF